MAQKLRQYRALVPPRFANRSFIKTKRLAKHSPAVTLAIAEVSCRFCCTPAKETTVSTDHSTQLQDETYPSTRKQQTVAGPVRFSGRSLFMGYETTVTLLPADSNTGIIFRRVDLTHAPDIPATVEFIAKVPRRTALAVTEDVRVETVEHLMAALCGLQVDNCIVEINAPELPAYDGSCRDFCDGILQAGLVQLDADAISISIGGTTNVRSDDGKQTLLLRPYAQRCAAITYQLYYGRNAVVTPQIYSAEITPKIFYEEVSAARTFVLQSEIKALKAMGYGRHLTSKDIVIVGDDGVIDNALRYPDEAARHKLLDCVGDLALSGTPFVGHVTACRSGHHLNHELARVLTNLKQATELRNAA